MATSISRGSGSNFRQQVDKVSRGNFDGFLDAVMPSGGVQVISMGVGVWTWAGVSMTPSSTVWPPPSDVLLGYEYGPSGNDFTGSLSGGSGSGYSRGRIINPGT